MVKGSTVCQGLGFPPHAGPVFDQPEPGRKIEPFKSLASSPGSIFFETLEADVIAIQIADRPEPIVGVGNHRDFEVIGLSLAGELRFRTIIHFSPKRGKGGEFSLRNHPRRRKNPPGTLNICNARIGRPCRCWYGWPEDASPP